METFKFKLRGATWTVRLVSKNEMERELNIELAPEKIPDGFAMGYTLFEKQLCMVRTDMHIDQVKSTLWHEICHAFLAPIGGSFTDEESGSLDTESVCNLVGEGLFELIPQMKNWPILVTPAWCHPKLLKKS